MKNRSRLLSPSIIDIEASGFGAESYPIEVGVILADGNRYCQLIRPTKSWTHWDETAEKVHGISRDLLTEHGRPPAEVARELNDFIGDTTVFSDAWVVDYPWLRTLFWAAQTNMRFRVSPIEAILSEEQLEIWAEARREVEDAILNSRHRASVDAEIIKTTFENTLKKTKEG